MNRTEAIETVKRYLPPSLFDQVYAAWEGGPHHVGAIYRRTDAGWEPLTGPGAEEETREAFGALDTLLTALDTLGSMETSDIPIPGPAEVWSEALLNADAAYAALEALLEEWETELDRQHSRDRDAEADRVLDPLDELPEEAE